ncbi:MAG: hypothetical protein K0S76_1709, partial [Herbinix sp.]|nr:hypothetical protein [Herbinix sp.]
MDVRRNNLFRILLIIMLITLFLTACQTSKIKNKSSDKNDSDIHLDANIISIEADAETELLDATVYEGMAYLVSQDNLIKYDLANGERYIVAEATGNTAICADEDNIYT